LSVRVSVIMTEAGSAAAVAPLADDPRFACRFWFAEAARRHVGLRSRPIEESEECLEEADILLLSMTGSEAETSLVMAARERGVPTVQVLDVWGPYGHRIAGPLADRIAVIDEAARADALACGMLEERIIITGQAAWECAGVLPPAQASVAAFISQPIARLYGDRLGYDEARALALLEAVALARPDLIWEILVVPHPAGDLLDNDPRRVTLPEALARAGTVLSPFSSAMVDALLGGRRVISLQPDLEGEDRCALSRHGLIPRATDIASLLLALPQPPASGDHLRASLAGSARRLGDLLAELTA
jgi:hypothetical protein